MKKLIVALVLLGMPAHAQSTRTTCYDAGATRICETLDQYGVMISKSRCYRSGADTRCETTAGSSSSSLPNLLPVPNLNSRK